MLVNVSKKWFLEHSQNANLSINRRWNKPGSRHSCSRPTSGTVWTPMKRVKRERLYFCLNCLSEKCVIGLHCCKLISLLFFIFENAWCILSSFSVKNGRKINLKKMRFGCIYRLGRLTKLHNKVKFQQNVNSRMKNGKLYNALTKQTKERLTWPRPCLHTQYLFWISTIGHKVPPELVQVQG